MTNEGRVTYYDNGVFTIDYGDNADRGGTLIHRPKKAIEHDKLLEAMQKIRNVLFEIDKNGTASGFRIAP
jgi:hypothetical protein